MYFSRTIFFRTRFEWPGGRGGLHAPIGGIHPGVERPAQRGGGIGRDARDAQAQTRPIRVRRETGQHAGYDGIGLKIDSWCRSL